MKICVYSCNFKNYRNESKLLHRLAFKKDIDYYFFTDDKTLKSNNWKIVYQELIPNLDNIPSARLTSKHIKFNTPSELLNYDVIVWADSKSLQYINQSLNYIQQLETYKILNIKHHVRKTLQEELLFTLKLKLEVKDSGEKFYNEVKNITYDSHLADTCIIIRKNEPSVNNLFARVFKILHEKGLQRDQNVFDHAIMIENFPICDIFYVDRKNVILK